ncbi:hypothetical protein [Haloarcula nitratireducens]|uniref:PGF-CTERM sorting domain-containing protein n=1 Tax=Haloarcula nitratireducens TaxID=2487749 RepID=A0AAW4PEZ6_9EURY|nr:hypothetical protein [Halomicroarcula nitratireducens]MBX0295842.1 hypothetical protein [Halomicroarcula nitratireducens]
MTTTDDSSRSYSRREVLAATGTVVGGTLAASGQAAAQSTRKAVIADGSATENDMTGFFVHVGQTTDPTDAQVADSCEFADWPAEETRTYDVKLIDRGRPDYEQYSRSLYVDNSTEVPPGTLFVINSQEQCTDGYVGIRLERLGSSQLEAAVSGDVRTATASGGDGGGDGGSGAAGPGFGVVATVAAALGYGALRGE